MAANLERIKKDVVSACRVLSQQKLVEGFGHVSARVPDSDRFIMTPRISLALVTEEDLLIMNLRGDVIEGSQAAPFEASLHSAIMALKPQINAITRIHARVANMFSVTDRRLEPVHNHGSFFAGRRSSLAHAGSYFHGATGPAGSGDPGRQAGNFAPGQRPSNGR
jgi:ribulose-5-phosphate 4-epimerase/fuculose-1-phosphate aldolase